MRKILLLTAPFAFMQPLNQGIAAGSKRVGPWRVEIHFSDTPTDLSAVVSAGRYDGVIVTYQASGLKEIEARGTPVVSALSSNPGVDNVALDEHAIGVMAAQHLIGCGYRSFAYYGYAETWSMARYGGFRDTLHAAGFPLATTFTGTVMMETSVPRMSPVTPEVFVGGLIPPVAVMACHDAAGREIADAAIERGWSVPGDVAVLGVDNDELLCETGACPLSSVDPNLYRLGFEAALLLDRKMRGGKHALPGPVAPREVVRRQSTSVFAHDDPDIASAMRIIHEKACGGISVMTVCEALGMSRRRFEQRFLRAVGRPPGTEIRQVRIERAKALLTETNLSITEIARRCGYAQVEGFSAAFRSVAGESPARYRRQQEEGVSDTPAPAREFPREEAVAPRERNGPVGGLARARPRR